jgi:hypothetical protein
MFYHGFPSHFPGSDALWPLPTMEALQFPKYSPVVTVTRRVYYVFFIAMLDLTLQCSFDRYLAAGYPFSMLCRQSVRC